MVFYGFLWCSFWVIEKEHKRLFVFWPLGKEVFVDWLSVGCLLKFEGCFHGEGDGFLE